MVGWLHSIFRGTRVRDLPLQFHVDTDDQGRHVTRVSYAIDGEQTWVEDVEALWSYGGFSVDRENVKYVVRPQDEETLLALRSVCSEVRPNGEIVSPICPPVLRYLRHQRTVSESESSQEYQVLEDPLELGATLDYDPQHGLMAEAGYRAPGTEKLIPEAELKVTPDGRYARIGKKFAPLPGRIGDAAQEWLRQGRVVVPPHKIPEFFQRDLVLFQSDFRAVLTDAAAKVEVVDLPPKPQVRVQTDERGWLEFQLGYVVGDYELPIGLVRDTEGGYVRPDANTFVNVPSGASKPVLQALDELGAQETPDGYRIPIAQFTSLEDFIEKIGGMREVNAAYQQFLDDLEGFEGKDTFCLSVTAEKDLQQADIRLRPYQRAGIHWLTWLVDHHLHGLLADDMGLGKTIQTAATLRYALEKRTSDAHSLVVCPKSVIRHWHRELKRCCPQLPVYEYIGPSRDRRIWERPFGGVVITTYATLARDVQLVAKTPLFFLVLDESTKIKNPETQRAEATKALNAAHRIALSGTPVENRPAELWSVFDFLMRGHLGRYGTFQRLFEEPIMSGNQQAAERLGRRIAPFLLRRRKDQVAKDLPEKIDMDPEVVDLTPEQRKLYVLIQRRYTEPLRASILRGEQVSRTSILGALAKLVQVCDHPALVVGQDVPVEGRSEKFDLAIERIEEITGDGHQVVVFTLYLKMLDLLQAALKDRGLSYTRLDGSMSMEQRQQGIDAFNEGHLRVALCSLRAMSHGVNLTAANHVIHVDHWWNPAIEDQATDRVHRIGQDEPVFVHRLIVADTLEEKIMTLHERKREVAKHVMDAAAERELRWTREELLELLKPLD